MFNAQFAGNAYQGRNQGFRTGNYNRAPYNPNWQGAPQYRGNNAPYRKKSGAKLTTSRKTNKPVITAWKKSQYAFLVMVATPNNGANIAAKGGQVITNAKGQEYARWTCTLTDRNTGAKTTHSGLYNLATGKLYITDLKLVANPKAPNGGYFGKSFVSKNQQRRY